MRFHSLLLIGCTLLLSHCQSPLPVKIVPEKGLQISHSCRIEPGIYRLSAMENPDSAMIEITGQNITVDFQQAELVGSDDGTTPDQFKGLAVRITNGHNITLKNLHARGYKVAVLAENVDSLRLIDCNFSYNYRQKLYSTWEEECYSDWLSYHNNEQDEWLRYGAAAYLKNCRHALVRNITVTQGQNGIMLVNSDNGWLYNNTIRFNSGVGIGLYRSSNNHIMHNRLDWNVRGHSSGRYARGQDSAGILCYEQSNGNVFAYNSATHSGDGFFLWAGQTTMDTGEGGCNDNLIFANDFSYAPTNGVEVTFSRNRVIGNRLVGCRYGIWAGYSFASQFDDNIVEDCAFGLAIEHGQDNQIRNNYFRNNDIGIQLWARAQQPTDWGYAREKDVSSRNYTIQANYFQDHRTALKIAATSAVNINQQNRFKDYQQLLLEESPNPNLNFRDNVIDQAETLDQPAFPLPYAGQDLPAPLPDGQTTSLPPTQLQGREYMIINEWGPYNFTYPLIQLRNVEENNKYTFLLLGPTGNWQLAGGQGFSAVNPKTGTFPATIVATAIPDSQWLHMQLEFIGDSITTQFGRRFAKGHKSPFSFSTYRPNWEWEVDWYNASGMRSQAGTTRSFLDSLIQTPAAGQDRTKKLDYTWWDAPAPQVMPDQFITHARTDLTAAPGQYRLLVTSDDGVLVMLDGTVILDHWSIHTPQTDELVLDLNGHHRLQIFHFEADGLSVLQARMEKM